MRLQPLAHMHMPFAAGTEMVYPAVPMYIMGHFLRGEPVGSDGLDGFFSAIDRLNHAFFGRLKCAVQRDGGINALLALHAHSMVDSLPIRPEMENIRAWFSADADE